MNIVNALTDLTVAFRGVLSYTPRMQATRLKMDQIFMLARQGKRIAEIATAVGIPGATVAAVLGCPAGKASISGRAPSAR